MKMCYLETSFTGYVTTLHNDDDDDGRLDSVHDCSERNGNE